MNDTTRAANAAQHRRTMKTALPWSLVRCCCGCDRRATHLGFADGYCMMSGCELTVRRWVRDGEQAWTAARAGARK